MKAVIKEGQIDIDTALYNNLPSAMKHASLSANGVLTYALMGVWKRMRNVKDV